MDQDFQPIRLIVLVSFAIFLILLWNKFDNILFLARTLFLGGIGYFPMLVKVINGPDVLFSGYEKSTQEFNIVILMYTATSLAVLGNEVGLYLGGRQKHIVSRYNHAYENYFWRIIFLFSIPILLWASFQAIRAGGQSVFVEVYASDTKELVLGNTIAIGVICLLAMWVALLKFHKKYDLLIFISLAIFFLVYALFIRGSRQDVLTPLLGMVVCYSLVKGQPYKITLKSSFIILLVYIVFEIWGFARQVMASTGIDLTYFIDIVISHSTDSSDAIQFGTVSPIATTFSNMIWLIEGGTLDMAWGKSYWEFILRTPPAFIYPDRPTDYAWIFQEYNLLAGGGFFELAEAYMNLGLVGALLFPTIISFLLSKSFFNALQKQTVLSYFLLFSFLGVFFRGTWYQTFAFYKSFLTALILFSIFWFIREITKTQKCSRSKDNISPLKSDSQCRL